MVKKLKINKIMSSLNKMSSNRINITGSYFGMSNVYNPPGIMQSISIASNRTNGVVLQQPNSQPISSIVSSLSRLGLSSFDRSVNVNKLFQHVDYQQNPSNVGEVATQVESYAVDTEILHNFQSGFFIANYLPLFTSTDIDFFGNGTDLEFFGNNTNLDF
jgi:hypothetical protein